MFIVEICGSFRGALDLNKLVLVDFFLVNILSSIHISRVTLFQDFIVQFCSK